MILCVTYIPQNLVPSNIPKKGQMAEGIVPKKSVKWFFPLLRILVMYD